MHEHIKRCCHCKKTKPLENFYRLKSAPDGRYKQCVECYKKLRETKKASIQAGRRTWERRLRREVFEHYGGKCACCGEKAFEFLMVSAVLEASLAKKRTTRDPLPYWLKRQKFPEGYRVLCYNCEHALGHHGFCPHGNLI